MRPYLSTPPVNPLIRLPLVATANIFRFPLPAPMSVIPSDSRGIPTMRGSHVSHARPPTPVIPSVSRGIPTMRGSHVSHARPPTPVIPSDSRGIPTVRGRHDCRTQPPTPVIPSDSRGIPTVGETLFPTPSPHVCHSERQPRNSNGGGEPSVPLPDPPRLSFRASGLVGMGWVG